MSLPAEEDRAFDVKIASTGAVYVVPPGESVVDVLAGHGIEIETMCTHGLCGTCVTGVLEGEPEHRDFHLTNAERKENRLFMPCCSRSRTPVLVLDL